MKTLRFFAAVLLLICISYRAVASTMTTNQFLSLVQKGSVAQVAKALSNDSALVDAKTEKGEDILFSAVVANNKDVANFLLKNYVSWFQSEGADGLSPLMASARLGYVDCAKLFLGHADYVDRADNQGRTALIHAAIRGQTALASLLLAAGADPRIKDSFRKDALGYAQMRGATDIASLLQQELSAYSDAQAYLSSKGFHLLGSEFVQAAQKNDFRLMRLFLIAGISINSEDAIGANALSYALAYRNDGMINFLESQKAVANEVGVYRILLGDKFNWSIEKRFKDMIAAAKDNNYSLFADEIYAGLPVSRPEISEFADARLHVNPLRLAVERKWYPQVKGLIALGADQTWENPFSSLCTASAVERATFISLVGFSPGCP